MSFHPKLTDKQLDAVGESGGVIGINFHVGFLRQDGLLKAETPISEIVRHIDYVVQRIGIEHVALGSDFDGTIMPQELGDAAGMPNPDKPELKIEVKYYACRELLCRTIYFIENCLSEANPPFVIRHSSFDIPLS